LWENVFHSSCFQEIAIVDNLTAVRKVACATAPARLRKQATLGFRALYIAARKSPRPPLPRGR